MKLLHNNKVLCLIMGALAASSEGCAGPTTPLGALWILTPSQARGRGPQSPAPPPPNYSLPAYALSLTAQREPNATQEPAPAPNARRVPLIQFTPSRQVLHGPYSMKIKIQMALDLAGFAVSAGSACSSGVLEPSHVLTAMGYSAAQGMAALRVSVAESTTLQELDAFVMALDQTLKRMRPEPQNAPGPRDHSNNVGNSL